VYSLQIYVPALNWVMAGEFPGLRLAHRKHPHMMILGRDFLSHFTLSYNGRSGTAMLYRAG